MEYDYGHVREALYTLYPPNEVNVIVTICRACESSLLHLKV